MSKTHAITPARLPWPRFARFADPAEPARPPEPRRGQMVRAWLETWRPRPAPKAKGAGR